MILDPEHIAAIATTCDTDNGHLHVYVVPVSDGYHLEFEDRVQEDRSGAAEVTVWQVREPVEPWLPAAQYKLLGTYGSIGDAFSDHVGGQAVPDVKCTSAGV